MLFYFKQNRDWKLINHKYSILSHPYDAFLSNKKDIPEDFVVLAHGMTKKEALEAIYNYSDGEGSVLLVNDMESIPGEPAFVIIGEVWYSKFSTSCEANEPVLIQYGGRIEVMRLCFLQFLDSSYINGKNTRRFVGVVVPMHIVGFNKYQTVKASTVLSAMDRMLQTWKSTAQDRLITANKNLERARLAERRPKKKTLPKKI